MMDMESMTELRAIPLTRTCRNHLTNLPAAIATAMNRSHSTDLPSSTPFSDKSITYATDGR